MSGLLIIGNGPAAWSCAITGRIRKLDVTVAGPENASSALARAARVDNYPGLPEKSGTELLSLMRQQALELGTKEEYGMATMIMPGTPHSVLIGNNVLTADAIVLCTGAPQGKPLPGEKEWLGQGVSYCATCDGRFYGGRKIAVLSECTQGASETVYLWSITQNIHYYSLRNHDSSLLPDGIVKRSGKPAGISREDNRMLLTLDSGAESYDAIFIFRRAYAVQSLLGGLMLSESGIAVDRGMKTNIDGIFAAGDCTGTPFQLAKAVGEGNIAALSAAEYIAQSKSDH